MMSPSVHGIAARAGLSWDMLRQIAFPCIPKVNTAPQMSLMAAANIRLLKRTSMLGLSALFLSFAARFPAHPQQGEFDTPAIEIVPVHGGVYMLVGAGGNITVQIGTDGVLVVDSMLSEASENVLAAIRELTDRPIRYVVNTHVHRDHVGGNANIGRQAARLPEATLREPLLTRSKAPA